MSDEVYEVVKELLPDIERELREEIISQLQSEYERRLEDHVLQAREEVQIQKENINQAQKEIESIFEEIQQQTFHQFQEKVNQLEEREKALIAQKSRVEQDIRSELETQYRKHFEEEKQVLSAQVIEDFNRQVHGGEIEEKLRTQMRAEMEEQMRRELEKKEKLMKINFKKKSEQATKALEEGFEMEWKQKVDGEKKLLEKERSEIARLKSLENIRLKKLGDEKKQFRLNMRDQERKYQEIVQSLQQQIVKLQDELDGLQSRYKEDMSINKQQEQQQVYKQQEQVQKQQESQNTFDVNSFKRSRNKIQQDHNESFIPLYQHSKLKQDSNLSFQSENQDIVVVGNQQQYPYLNQQQQPDINQYLFGGPNKREPIIDKDTAKSFVLKYQQELNKLMNKAQDKENDKVILNKQEIKEVQHTKYLEVLRRKDREEPIPKPPTNQYEQIFILNDLDNEKNQQMKKIRRDILNKQQRDQQLKQKYEGMTIYMQSELLSKYRDDPKIGDLKELLIELFEIMEAAQVSNEERIELLRDLQHSTRPDTISPLIPLIQKKIIQLKQYSGLFELLWQREELKSRITDNYQGFAKCRGEWQQLKDIGVHLSQAKMKWRGISIDQLISMDQWEMEFLQREELKTQLLRKIQSKIL